MKCQECSHTSLSLQLFLAWIGLGNSRYGGSGSSSCAAIDCHFVGSHGGEKSACIL